MLSKMEIKLKQLNSLQEKKMNKVNQLIKYKYSLILDIFLVNNLSN